MSFLLFHMKTLVFLHTKSVNKRLMQKNTGPEISFLLENPQLFPNLKETTENDQIGLVKIVFFYYCPISGPVTFFLNQSLDSKLKNFH